MLKKMPAIFCQNKTTIDLILRLAALGAGLADAFDRNNLITAKSGPFVEGFEDKIRYADSFK